MGKAVPRMMTQTMAIIEAQESRERKPAKYLKRLALLFVLIELPILRHQLST
jgi:hypothetical protein